MFNLKRCHFSRSEKTASVALSATSWMIITSLLIKPENSSSSQSPSLAAIRTENTLKMWAWNCSENIYSLKVIPRNYTTTSTLTLLVSQSGHITQIADTSEVCTSSVVFEDLISAKLNRTVLYVYIKADYHIRTVFKIRSLRKHAKICPYVQYVQYWHANNDIPL